MSYEVFKDKIIELLTNNHFGLTWTVIQKKLQLPQIVPNNRWIRQLEGETGLSRRKDNNDTFWFLPDKGVAYTIGYEGKTSIGFIDKLKRFTIEQVIDVRENALSRKNGFAKTALRKTLSENGIVYKHLPELGSPNQIRKNLRNAGDYNEFFKEYTEYLNTDDAKKALTELKDLAYVRKTVLMCFEFDVKKCHRKIIKEYLIANGFGVVDL